MENVFRILGVITVAYSLFAFTTVYNKLAIALNYDIKFSTRAAEVTFSGLKGVLYFEPNI